MKIGMPALIESDTLEENVMLCKQLGFDFIELNMNFPYNMINNVMPKRLKKLSKENNIEFTMHMPDDADIGSFHEDIKNGYLKLFIDTIKWADSSNVKLLNMHIIKGAYMTLPDKKIYINEKYCDTYVKNFLSSMKIISEEAAKHNIAMCIENSSNFNLNYVHEILEKALSLDNIYLTWDVGHDYMSGYSDKKIILKYKDKIKHMHLHDANQKGDHLTLKDGDLNVEELLRFSNQNNLTTLIEVKSKTSLIKSREVLNSICCLSFSS